ncbi:MBL fold metallo-hydrolase [Duganella sp. FT94W]|uniref:MBL fold metallo-hydrolase n=1 Tax=Duganella lactea TaxID=2692173 RepID=A0ABW9V265_9BURK|nr:MBL fold metallo-hydrolase [Duganella lactea]MYM32843.1 MBL fold metallo-hydrolase [Duganella lactea]
MENSQTFKLTVIPAGHGDCFLVQCGQFNLLIDSGPSSADIRLRAHALLVKALGRRQVIDLAIVTHYDDDHIGGMVHMLRSQSVKVERLLFNSPKLIQRFIDERTREEVRITAADACEISELLPPCNDTVITAGAQLKLFGERVILDVLSPLEDDIVHYGASMIASLRREGNIGALGRDPVICPTRNQLLAYPNPSKSDNSAANCLSLAFRLTFAGHKILFLGDSWPSRVSQSLPGDAVHTFDLVVVSHHGSQYNSTLELYKKVAAPDYLVSTDGRRHPDIETFARIVKTAGERDLTFHFSETNDALTAMFKESDLKRRFPEQGVPLVFDFSAAKNRK